MFNLDGIYDCVRVLRQDLSGDLKQWVTNNHIIFHCAATTSHSRSMSNPATDLGSNCAGTLNLLEACRKYNPKVRFIYTGTSTQIGKQLYRPADENHPQFQLDMYSANKNTAENYVRIYATAHGLNTSSIRFANLYGPRAAIHTASLTFNNYFIGLALQGKAVTIYGKGDQRRNIMYISDAVNALIMTAKHTSLAGEVFFACSEDHFSIASIGEEIAKTIGDGLVEYIDWPVANLATEIGDVLISSKKLRQAVS